MKRTNNPLLLLFLLVWLAGGCTQTEVEEKDIPPHALKEVEAVFNLRVKASQTSPTRSATTPGDTLQTRAEADLQPGRDSEISGIWIGQYNAEGNLLYHYYNGALKGNTLNVMLKQNPAGDKSESHVWFIANSGNLGEIALEKIATEAGLKEYILPYKSKNGLPESNLCSMTGMWSGQVKEEGNKGITVELTRLVAKITFTYTIDGSANSFSFTPSSITLNSVPDKSQIEAPTAQLSTEKITYTTYTEEVGNSDNSRTFYWYLPENMAGDGDKVESEKKKTGKGVENATYIELAGTAVQGDVTYENVVFRFYPGKTDKTDKLNNYDIVRNSHYTMNVTLVGIDITDERITVGKIPPIEVTEGNMPAEKGGTKEVQITARPGQEWMFDLVDWLKAIINDKDAPTGAQITGQGPAKVTFQSTEANSKAESRKVVFPVNVGGTTQEITITQNGSTLVKGENIMLGAASGSEGASSFTATKGVKWQVDGTDNWWNWVAADQVTSGDEATGEEQPLNIKATASNPSSYQRSGTITVKAGESVGNPNYDKLKQEITITQAGSTLTGSTKTVAAEAANSLTSTFTATPGLNWTANVTNDSWITLATTSGGPTTESAENIYYNVAVNPTSSERSDAITVRAGNVEDGPKGTITVTQAAASLAANVDKANLAATANDSGTLTYQATAGLPLSIDAPDWLNLTGEVSGTTTDGENTIGYKSKLNLNSAENTGNISVKAGEMVKDVPVTQAGSVFEVSPTTLELGKMETSGTITITGTTGLPWTITRKDGTEEISSSSDGGILSSGSNTLTFSATENTGGSRSAEFTIAVEGGNHSKMVEVTQMGATLPGISLTIDQSVLTSYKAIQTDMRKYPPFNAEGMNNYHGCIVDETAGTINGFYTIQVQKDQWKSTANYVGVQSYCAEVTEDETPKGSWRLPTLIELYAMYINKEKITTTGGSPFLENNIFYWSRSVYNSEKGVYSVVYLGNGIFSYFGMDVRENYVRCVRDI